MFLLQMQQLQLQPTETLPTLAIARSDGIELLRDLYFREIVTPYEETLENGHVVRKHFRKGGPLEWYVPLDDPQQMFVDIGAKEDRIEELMKEVRRKFEVEWTAMLVNTGSVNTQEELEKFVSAQS